MHISMSMFIYRGDAPSRLCIIMLMWRYKLNQDLSGFIEFNGFQLQMLYMAHCVLYGVLLVEEPVQCNCIVELQLVCFFFL